MVFSGLTLLTFYLLLFTFYISIHSLVFSALDSKIIRKVNGTKKKKNLMLIVIY